MRGWSLDRETEHSDRALVAIRKIRLILLEAERAEKDEVEQRGVNRMLEPLFKEAQFWEKAVKRWEEVRDTFEQARAQRGDRAVESVETMTGVLGTSEKAGRGGRRRGPGDASLGGDR